MLLEFSEMTISLRHRIFVSAVSGEFVKERAIVASAIRALGYEPEYQDEFMTESGDLREILRTKVDSCYGLIQIVGTTYGFEPPTTDPEFGRVSYTQYELLYARLKGKRIWLFLPSEISQKLESPNTEADELQAKYARELINSSLIWHSFESESDLKEKLFKLRNDLENVRKSFASWQFRILVAIGCLGALLAVLTVMMQYGQTVQRKQIESLSNSIKEERERQNSLTDATSDKLNRSKSSEISFSLLRSFGEPELESGGFLCNFPAFEPAQLTLGPNIIVSSLDLAIEATIVNSTVDPIVIDKVGIRVVRVAEFNHMPLGDWEPFRVKVSDSFEMEMPNVYAEVSSKIGFSITPELVSYLRSKNVDESSLSRLSKVTDWQAEYLSSAFELPRIIIKLLQLTKEKDARTAMESMSPSEIDHLRQLGDSSLFVRELDEIKANNRIDSELKQQQEVIAELPSLSETVAGFKSSLSKPDGYRGKEPYLFQEFLSRYVDLGSLEVEEDNVASETKALSIPKYASLTTNVVELDRNVTLKIEDPVFVPPNSPYRFRLKAKSFGERMPNFSQIRLLVVCGEKTFESPIINVAMAIVRGAKDEE